MISLPTALIDTWCQYAKKSISLITDANGLIHVDFSFDAATQAVKVHPEHAIVAFPTGEKGRHRNISSLLSLRVVGAGNAPEGARRRSYDQNAPPAVASQFLELE